MSLAAGNRAALPAILLEQACAHCIGSASAGRGPARTPRAGPRIVRDAGLAKPFGTGGFPSKHRTTGPQAYPHGQTRHTGPGDWMPPRPLPVRAIHTFRAGRSHALN
jgi:hypothetical protein